jgi:propionyl-CoA synthetase
LVADGDRLVIAGNPVGLGLLPVKHGSPTVPMPGYDVQVVDEAGHPVPRGHAGQSIVVKLPLPPGLLAHTVERR